MVTSTQSTRNFGHFQNWDTRQPARRGNFWTLVPKWKTGFILHHTTSLNLAVTATPVCWIGHQLFPLWCLFGILELTQLHSALNHNYGMWAMEIDPRKCTHMLTLFAYVVLSTLQTAWWWRSEINIRIINRAAGDFDYFKGKYISEWDERFLEMFIKQPVGLTYRFVWIWQLIEWALLENNESMPNVAISIYIFDRGHS